MSMFCFQCQETAGNKGCTIKGVCGKDEKTANLQDLLLWLLKGISYWAEKGRPLGVEREEIDLFVAEGLFSTITNANFDSFILNQLIDKALRNRKALESSIKAAYKEKNGEEFKEEVPECAEWFVAGGVDIWNLKGAEVGVLQTQNEDIRSLRELITYGAKGIAAYTDHAYILEYKNGEILRFIEKALAATTDDSLGADSLADLVMETGKYAVEAMALLDKANTRKYGNPEITIVSTGTRKGPAILVCGHDLRDLEELLIQTEGKGVNIYTHGEMLPANAYPELKKYSHLAGNYGTSWYNQQREFAAFNGAILMTTNCIQEPLKSYKGRIFTTGLVGWPGVFHIPDRKLENQKNFSEVIYTALALGGLEETKGMEIPIGFSHEAVSNVAGDVVEAIKAGKIKRFVVMAGCDGHYKSREYFTEVASKLPKDTVILTAGCAKYRYNMLGLGDIDGIPRVLDAGQCNDSYSLVLTALKLKEVFGMKDINDLPISYDIAWYEQKAVAVLLALLYMGVKGIRLGPTLPAFLSPGVTRVLVEKFDIKATSSADQDIKLIAEGK